MSLDRASLSAVGHRGLPFWSPVTVALLDHLVDALAIEPGTHILDIGCGDGAMLAHVTRRLAGTGTGVDRLPGALALAARHPGPLRWTSTVPPMIDGTGNGTDGAARPDLLLAIGSLSADEAAALPCEALLLGELVGLGASPVEGLPRPGLAIPERHGWRLVVRVLVGEAELRAYEATWLGNVRAWAAAHPDTDVSAAIEAHEQILEAGGLGFEVTGWRR